MHLHGKSLVQVQLPRLCPPSAKPAGPAYQIEPPSSCRHTSRDPVMCTSWCLVELESSLETRFMKRRYCNLRQEISSFHKVGIQ